MKQPNAWPIAAWFALTLLCCQFLLPAHAAKRAGVELDDTIAVGESELVLNGSGIRKRLFIKLYVGSLYLLESNQDAAAIIAADEPMALRLNIISDLLTQKKMAKALKTGFKNATGGDTSAIQPQIDQLIAGMNEKIQTGDGYTLAYEPGVGTRVSKNGEEQLIIEGLPFKQALFGIWLSDKPAQASLKSGMLGS